ncbi:AAA family ATPase [Parabacteroides sp.]
MEKISVTDFGPIRHAEIEIKPFCILIGHTSSGKSTMAKLLDLFNSQEFYTIKSGNDLNVFTFHLKKYDIDFEFKEHTCIVYENNEYTWTITQKGIQTNYPYCEIMQDWRKQLKGKFTKSLKEYILSALNCLNEEIRSSELHNLELYEQFTEEKLKSSYYFRFYSQLINKHIYKGNDSTYIPAERILMSVLSQSIFSFYDKGINLPDCIKVFGNLYSITKSYSPYKIDFLNLEVIYNNDTDAGDKIRLKNGEEISFSQASSGLQSVIPLLSVFDLGLAEDSNLIIEEPELNLYTQVQKDLTEYLVRRTKEKKAKLFITTHSPYILSTIQNLLQAGNIAAESPEKAELVAKLVSPDKWIDYNDLTCQFFSSDGTSYSILDDEYHTIGINQMDDVSAELSEIYDSLLDIKYNE